MIQVHLLLQKLLRLLQKVKVKKKKRLQLLPKQKHQKQQKSILHMTMNLKKNLQKILQQLLLLRLQLELLQHNVMKQLVHHYQIKLQQQQFELLQNQVKVKVVNLKNLNLNLNLKVKVKMKNQKQNLHQSFDQIIYEQHLLHHKKMLEIFHNEYQLIILAQIILRNILVRKKKHHL